MTALRLAPPSSVPTAVRPLRLINLLNDLDTLVDLLRAELRHGSVLNAFLLTAGITQVAEDYLDSDRSLLLKASRHMASSRNPAIRLMSRALRGVDVPRRGMRRLWADDARVEDWLEDAESLRAVLATALMADGASSAGGISIGVAGRRALAMYDRLPSRLRHSVIRLPSCFRSFDQHPDDMARLATKFASETPDRARPVAVVGVRTSGSYLAPLVAAALTALGFRDVATVTIRPGHPLRATQRHVIGHVRSGNGTALVVDDPPTTGTSMRMTAEALGRHGIRGDAVALLVCLSSGARQPPPALERNRCIVLPWEEWSICDRLEPPSVLAALSELLGARGHVATVERVLEEAETRGHAFARYRVTVIEGDGRKTSQLDVHATGAGLGYFGEHSLEIAERLGSFSPQIYGFSNGILYRDWLPSSRRLERALVSAEPFATRSVTDYVMRRATSLRVPKDASLQLRGRMPAWEALSNLLSRGFGRGWAWSRIPLVDPLVKRTLRVDAPSVVDGSMAPANWYGAGARRKQAVKVDADRRAFANVDLAIYDAVYDVASVSADAELASADRGRTGPADRRFREAYEEASGSKITAERWFLLQALHLWDRLRLGDGDPSSLRRALSRASQRYFAEVFLQGISTPVSGPLVALDVDGVLESEAIGFSALTSSSALALRALHKHGFRPVLMTGRSLAEVRDRCQTLSLAGGVAEYGSVVYDHVLGTASSMLSEHRLRNIARARAVVGRLPGVAVDSAYNHSVRAFVTGGDGRRRRPDVTMIEQALRESGLEESVQLVAGDSQVDIVAVEVSKGAALAQLQRLLGADADGIALAVGDGPRDISAFPLARMSVAPAHASAQVRTAARRKSRRAYQRGLADATRMLIGHRPGGCRTCRGARMPADRAALVALFSAQENGVQSMLGVALGLGIRNLLGRLHG